MLLSRYWPFVLVNGVLYYEEGDVPERRLEVPSHLQQKVMMSNMMHFLGHCGYKKM